MRKFYDLLFVDINGAAKAVGVTAEEFEKVVKNNKWFDSSSIKGGGDIENSDKMLKPDVATTMLLPWREHGGNQRVIVLCDILNADDSPYEGDPQQCLRRALADVEQKGWRYLVGSEIEFFILKQTEPHDKGGYFQHEALDEGEDMREEISCYLEQLGMKVKALHHEVASGQHEISIEHADAATFAYKTYLLKMAISYVAKKHGYRATFMPKPFVGENGSGMHTHQSLADKDGKNLFYNPDNVYGLSETAQHFLAGQLARAEQYCCLIAPTVNSYKRLVPGYEAPAYVCWGRKNRSAMIRVPACTADEAPQGTRLELRAPDPSCNPYLAYAAMLNAGLWGIENKVPLPAAIEKNAYHMSAEERTQARIATLPGSLIDALRSSYTPSPNPEASIAKKTLGPLYQTFVNLKKKEWQDFHSFQVTPWELENYL